MKIMQAGYYDILLTVGVAVTGLSAWEILLSEGHYEIFLVFIGLAMSLVLFLISWVTLSLFTRDIQDSAVASARTAGVYFGLMVGVFTVLFKVGLTTLLGLWATIAFFTEIVVVSVGMSYLHFINRKKGVVSGLIISAAFIAFLFMWDAMFGP